MKKRLTILLMLVMTLSLLLIPALGGCTQKVRVFKIYNCQDYIEDDDESSVLDDFAKYYENKTGERIKVQYDTFDTLERAYTIINKRKADYDVFCPSDYIIEKMKKADLLNPLNKSLIPNLKNIPPYLLDRNFDEDNQYSVPYMWGTLGILYNADKIAEEDIRGWDLLWNEKYKNDILMKDSIRDSVFIATIYAYRDELSKITDPVEYRNKINDLVNNVSAEKIAIVEKELREQYNILYAYEVDSGKDSMINGEALINLAWSGDAVWAIEEASKNNINLDYYIPQEGSNVWFDNWVIPKYAKNEDIAHEFINFLCEPEIALRNMEFIGYTTAVLASKDNPEAIEYMIDESVEPNDFSYLFEDRNGNISDENKQLIQFYKDEYGIDFYSLQIHEVSMPSKEKTQNCVEMTDFGEQQDLIVKMWTRVKALPLGVEVKIFSICLAIVIVGLIAYSIYKKVEKKKQLAVKIEQIGETATASSGTTNFLYTFNTKMKSFGHKVKDNYIKLTSKFKKKKDIEPQENINTPDLQADSTQSNQNISEDEKKQ